MSDHPHFLFFLDLPPFQSFTFTLLHYKTAAAYLVATSLSNTFPPIYSSLCSFQTLPRTHYVSQPKISFGSQYIIHWGQRVGLCREWCVALSPSQELLAKYLSWQVESNQITGFVNLPYHYITLCLKLLFHPVPKGGWEPSDVELEAAASREALEEGPNLYSFSVSSFPDYGLPPSPPLCHPFFPL